MRKLLILWLLLLSIGCSSREIVLTEKNHVYLNAPVLRHSMDYILSELQRLDKLLPAGEPLYLVLKTPGGSVIAGMDFIDAAKHLSRPITTVSIRSISMGFQIIQSLGKRLATNKSLIMTHPISGGCEGRVPEMQSCVDFMQKLADAMDIIAAKRINMSLSEYVRRSASEWWEVGHSAVDAGFIDEIVEIKCNKEVNSKNLCPY